MERANRYRPLSSSSGGLAPVDPPGQQAGGEGEVLTGERDHDPFQVIGPRLVVPHPGSAAGDPPPRACGGGPAALGQQCLEPQVDGGVRAGERGIEDGLGVRAGFGGTQELSHLATVRAATPRCSANTRTLIRSARRRAWASRPLHWCTVATRRSLSRSIEARSTRAGDASATEVQQPVISHGLDCSARSMKGPEPRATAPAPSLSTSLWTDEAWNLSPSIAVSRPDRLWLPPVPEVSGARETALMGALGILPQPRAGAGRDLHRAGKCHEPAPPARRSPVCSMCSTCRTSTEWSCLPPRIWGPNR